MSTPYFQKPVRSLIELKQKRRGAARHGIKKKDNYLSSGNRRDSRDPFAVKSTHTDAQKHVAKWFVSHSGGIITQIFRHCLVLAAIL
jgi:hypothetical protein